MPITTMKIQSEVRDQLARIAATEYPGAPLSDVLVHLLAEHEDARMRREMAAAYTQLHEDRDRWSSYLAELEEWDGVSADQSESA
jgi:hypothetical protein